MMYRDWSAICKTVLQFSPTHTLVQILLAAIDLETESGERLANEFPEFFSKEPVCEAIPLSVLMEEARVAASCEEASTSDKAGEHLNLYRVVGSHGNSKHDIPTIHFRRKTEDLQGFLESGCLEAPDNFAESEIR